MSEKIRQVTYQDIPALEKLYKSEKSITELKWVLENPYNSNVLDGFIVENVKGEILGMIGYEVGKYRYNEKTMQGAIFMSWKISEGYKGFAGIRLVSSVLSKGDFGMAIQGSEMAQSMYNSLGLKNINLSAYTFIKVFRPIKYFQSLKGRPLIRRIGSSIIVLPSLLKCSTFTFSNNLSIKLIDSNKITKDIPYRFTNYFEKEITKEYLTWLVSCPLHDSYVFEITKKSEFIGYSICYVQKTFNISPKGRIVYLPNMGDNKSDWSELLSSHISFLKMKKCCSISVLGSYHFFNKILQKQHCFINYKSKQKPIFIKDPKNLFGSVPLDKWYMQYTESDKAYRSF